MSRMAGPPADPGRGDSPPAESAADLIRGPDDRGSEPYQRPNPETIEDADELRASVERIIRRAGSRFREEQRRLVEAGVVDGEGRLLAGAPPPGVATGTGDDDR